MAAAHIAEPGDDDAKGCCELHLTAPDVCRGSVAARRYIEESDGMIASDCGSPDPARRERLARCERSARKRPGQSHQRDANHAALSLAIMPVLILYVIFSRQLIRGSHRSRQVSFANTPSRRRRRARIWARPCTAYHNNPGFEIAALVQPFRCAAAGGAFRLWHPALLRRGAARREARRRLYRHLFDTMLTMR